MKVTNNSGERQAVHTKAGVIFIHPGKSRDVDLTDAGEKLVEEAPGLTIDGRTRRGGRKPEGASE